MKVKPNPRNAKPPTTFLGWMSQGSASVVPNLNSSCFWENWIHFSLAWHIDGSLRLLPSRHFWPSLVEIGVLLKRLLRSRFPTNDETKFLLPLLQVGISYGTCTKAQREVAFRWLVTHEAVAVYEWQSQISGDIDKSCPHCGSQFVESVEHMSFNCPLAQQVW